MSNPEQPAGGSDQSWHPMPAPGNPAPGSDWPGSTPPGGAAPGGWPGYPPGGIPPATQPGSAQPAGTSPTAPMYPYDPGQGYPAGAYGAPYAAGYGYGAVTQTTNGMAIGSMVVSIVSMAGLCAYGFGGLLGIVGAILGHVARRQIRERGEGGDGMALAGIIVGWIATGLAALIITMIVFFVWTAVNADTNSLAPAAGALTALIR